MKNWKSKHLLPGSAKFAYMVPFLFCSFLNWKFDEMATNNALPEIAKQYGVSKSIAQWAQTAYFIATAAFAIPFNKLGHKYGLVLLCQVLLVFSFVFEFSSSFMPNFISLLIMKFLTGAIAGGIVANRNAMVSKMNPEKGAAYLANVVIVNGVASIIIPLIAGAIIDKRWQMIYVFSGGVSVVAFVLSLFFTNPQERIGRINFDYFGSASIVFGVGGLCAGLTLLSKKLYVYAIVSLAIAISALVFFAFIERKHPEAILPLFLMKNPVSDLAISHTLAFIGLSGHQYILPQVFSQHSASSFVTGAVMTASQVTNFLTAILQKLIGKKVCNRITMEADCLMYVIFTALEIVFINNLTAFSICYTVSVTFLTHANEVQYPALIMAAPLKYNELLAGIPTCARTIGNSIAYCFFTFLQEIIVDNAKGTELERFNIGAEGCFGANVAIGIVMYVLVMFRVGNAPNEQGKLGYSEKKIRELEIDEKRIQTIKAEYYEKHGIVEIPNITKII